MSSPAEVERTVGPTGGSHGGGDYRPGPGDCLIVVLSVIVVAVATYLAIRYLLWPGETGAEHIKRRILREESS